MDINYNKILPYTGEPDKERLINAFKRKPVDRVPNWDFLVEDSHVEKILGRFAGNTFAYGGNPAKGASNTATRPMYPDDYIDFCNIIGQDSILFDGGLWTPFKRENEKGELVLVTDRSVKNRKDFKKITLDSETQIEYTLKYLREYKEAVKKRNSKLAVSCCFGILIQTLYEFLVGMNDFMLMVYEDRGLVEDMLEISTLHYIKLVKAIISEGVDYIFPADDLGFKSGLFLAPNTMRELWVSRYKRILEPAVNANVPIIFHCDGKIDELVYDFIDMGIDCLNPMDPYSVDYREYKKKFGSEIALSGNIDIEFPLTNGNPEDVYRDVKEHMSILKENYGYVASCSHSIVDYIPHENYIAYLNAIHEYGKY